MCIPIAFVCITILNGNKRGTGIVHVRVRVSVRVRVRVCVCVYVPVYMYVRVCVRVRGRGSMISVRYPYGICTISSRTSPVRPYDIRTIIDIRTISALYPYYIQDE